MLKFESIPKSRNVKFGLMIYETRKKFHFLFSYKQMIVSNLISIFHLFVVDLFR